MLKHYLDYNATAPVRPEVIEVIRQLQPLPLNPSSAHSAGRKAKGIIDNSRRKLAEIIGAFANEIIFTSSGTEANNWAIRAFPGYTAIVSAIEHSSILKTAHLIGTPIIIPVTGDGIIDINALAGMLPATDKFIVSVMLANNETGIIQPIREIADIVHRKNGIIHCDAVQAFGKIPIDFTNLGCDLMTISAHKMGGPIGAAALIAKSNITLPPFLIGGGQELNRRAGTENVSAIAGFTKSAELIDFGQMKKIREWLDKFEGEIETMAPSATIGRNSPRLPNTTCVTMPNVSSEIQIISFDLENIAVSAGSACSSGKIEPSHVLTAIGLNDQETKNALRISCGWATTEHDIMALTKAWKKLFLRKTSV